MNTLTFEEYLQEKYIEQEQIIDDVIPDDFNEWLKTLDIDNWLYYGDKYADLKYTRDNVPL